MGIALSVVVAEGRLGESEQPGAHLLPLIASSESSTAGMGSQMTAANAFAAHVHPVSGGSNGRFYDVAALSRGMKAPRARGEVSSADIDTIFHKGDPLSHDVAAPCRDVDALSGNADGLRNDVEALSGNIGALRFNVAALSRHIETLHQGFNALIYSDLRVNSELHTSYLVIHP